jgi:hypothetical protein
METARGRHYSSRKGAQVIAGSKGLRECRGLLKNALLAQSAWRFEPE